MLAHAKLFNPLRIAKKKIYIFSSRSKKLNMQPILVSCEAPFRRNLQKKTLVKLGTALTGTIVQTLLFPLSLSFSPSPSHTFPLPPL